jgi:hypothetical protein
MWLEHTRAAYQNQLEIIEDEHGGESTTALAPETLQWIQELKIIGVPIDRVSAFQFWRWYFASYPSHGEYAGTWCRILFELGEWKELLTILHLLKEETNDDGDDDDAGQEQFSFDS